MKTNVTIISINISKNILKLYSEYKVVEGNFKIEELLNYQKVIFFNSLNNKSDKEIKELYNLLKEKNIFYINVTNNTEEVLFTDYLMVYDNDKVLIEGKTMDVLKEEKLLKRLGISLPFLVELSYLLEDYDLIDKVYLDYESLGSALWN